MATLLRLTTEDNNARFDTQINGDLILKPNSSIALQNICFEVSKSNLVINSTNNKITYSLSANSYTTDIILDNAIYTINNISSFFNDIQTKLNNSLLLSTNRKTFGGQFQINKNGGKLSINYKLSNVYRFGVEPTTITHNCKKNSANIFDRNGGIPGSFDSYAALNKIMGSGCCVFQSRIYRLNNQPALGLEGIVLGVSTTKPDSSVAGNMAGKAKIKYGIWAKSQVIGTKYQIIKDGIDTVLSGDIKATSAGGDNDVMTIMYEEGKIKIKVYTALTGTVDLLSEDYDMTVPLYPVIYFIGDTKTASVPYDRADLIDFTTDPFNDSVHNSIHKTELGSLTPKQLSQNTPFFIDFNTISLADYLGFNSSRIPDNSTLNFTTSLSINGDNNYELVDLADNFVVILDNIELDSYDSLSKQRQSILATVPASDETGNVIYDSKYPNYIKLKNKNPVYLRNVKARILKNDLTSLVTSGLTTMTLLIKND
jgi:hypothetical protein